MILSEGETFFVDETWLTHGIPKVAAPTAPLVADLIEHEREILEAALRESEGRLLAELLLQLSYQSLLEHRI
jgi:hypothetical protein